MFNFFCLLLGIFGVIILRYRIHFQITVSRGREPQRKVPTGVAELTVPKRRAARAETPALRSAGDDRPLQFERSASKRLAHVQRGNSIQGVPVSSGPHVATELSPLDSFDSVVWGDLASALINLGAKKSRAEHAAQHVVRNWPEKSFDEQLKAAIQEVQAA